MRTCKHRDCGSPLASVARYCPRCGRRAGEANAVWAIAGALLALTVVLVLFVLVAGRSSRTAAVPTQAITRSAERPVFTRPPGRP